MKLQSITIKNYRSIEEITFDFNQLEDKSLTYGLIGVNEVGKSSLLKAMALKDGLKDKKGQPLPQPKDFKDKSKPIEIIYHYELEQSEIEDCKKQLSTQSLALNLDVDLSKFSLIASFTCGNPAQAVISVEVVNISSDIEQKNTIQNQLKLYIQKQVHKSIFWTAEDRYLISDPINLDSFKNSPETVSVPLKNCFYLAGITDIKKRISSLNDDSTEIELLQNELGDKVTEHIKKVWPKHPIEITFLISGGFINFHVKDVGASGRAKTADQRSDGFKQFISFLLTISAQNKNEELNNSVLLLDEPETHLHPQAQEYLLNELIKITQNNRNNIVFFATHSNYMIDKNNLSRNFKILKEITGGTKKHQFDKKISTYASVNYEVFDIVSADYHSELYSKLHQKYQERNESDESREKIKNFDDNFFVKEKKLKKDRPWKKVKNGATLPTYIRNCIHHPDGGHTYEIADLRESIESLRSYFVELNNKN